MGRAAKWGAISYQNDSSGDEWMHRFSVTKMDAQIFFYDPTTNAIINIGCNMAIRFPLNHDCAINFANLSLEDPDGSPAHGWTVSGAGIMGADLQDMLITNERCNHMCLTLFLVST